ncbi:helix-turn-helix domain-containing protein [Sorangium sp. So ce136]|uniref:helix-turn-helix domain-containing protein n=1 Tax=Sorangium sp. So ce136 TaxID=3133284 RepID=UPI003EFF5735
MTAGTSWEQLPSCGGICSTSAARSCLEGGRASIKQLARDCGFGTDERMRRAFQRALQVTPEEYRRRFGRS